MYRTEPETDEKVFFQTLGSDRARSDLQSDVKSESLCDAASGDVAVHPAMTVYYDIFVTESGMLGEALLPGGRFRFLLRCSNSAQNALNADRA